MTRQALIRTRALARVGAIPISNAGVQVVGFALTSIGLTIASAVAGYYFFGIIGAIAGPVLLHTSRYWLPILVGGPDA